MAGTTLIVGAGHAGVQMAASLRELKHDGRIILVNDETALPYHRPPLSKHLLTPGEDHGQLLRPALFYDQQAVELRPGTRVLGIDTVAQSTFLANGETIGFDNLVLATGSRARTLPFQGDDLPNVHTLRSQGDAAQIAATLADARHVVVVGAGMIGLEFAAVAAKSGRTTTVIDAVSRPLLRAVSEEMARFLRATHEAQGVRFLFNDGIVAAEGHGKVTAVTTQSGERIPADLVLVAAGAVPNAELAIDAGLRVENGIVVDQFMRTSHPNIYAIGDCASFPTEGGSWVRLESVQNATDQARAAASAIAGQGQPYRKMPWFWSDQYDLKLQIAGLWTGYDRAIERRGRESNSFALYLYRDAQLICVEAINSAADHAASRKLIGEGIPLAPEQAADETFDIKSFMRAHAQAPATRS